RHQGQIISAIGAINKWFLPVSRCFHDVVPDKTESLAQVQAWSRDVLDQRRCVRTVLAVAIQCGQTGLCCKGDQRIGGRGLDPCKTSTYRSRSERSLHRVRE